MTREIVWTPPTQTRRPSPRSTQSVRAKVAHTAVQKRRLEVFVTAPVRDLLGWTEGGVVQAAFSATDDAFKLRLSPAHVGLRATRVSAKSPTLRIVVSGGPLAAGLCAKVCEVPYAAEDGALIVWLPTAWAAETLLPPKAEGLERRADEVVGLVRETAVG